MTRNALLLAGLVLFASAPAFAASDEAAIAKVLENYRTAVSTDDEALFSTTILDDQIPFFSARSVDSQKSSLQSADTRDVAGFRKAIFHSGKHYSQSFDSIRIRRNGSLAQAWLHFVTLDKETGRGGEGWKTLALLKVGDDWKIASEFYTAWPLGAEGASRVNESP